ncbi:MAG: ISH6 family transposase, partial [Candidatus Freyarchaeota archaeon]|nr:ISH6 family transposase [Candidatus Jordarchaeia archaeon]
DEKKLEEYCGPGNARGNGEKRYKRAGTKKRHPVTSIGRLDLKLHLVEDHLKDKIFKPVEDIISFDGRKVYQEDISMAFHGLS